MGVLQRIVHLTTCGGEERVELIGIRLVRIFCRLVDRFLCVVETLLSDCAQRLADRTREIKCVIAGFDGITNLHRLAQAASVMVAAGGFIEQVLRIRVAMLLKIDVLQPREAMQIGFAPLLRQRVCRLVRVGGVLPHSELQKNVRWHVQRVRRRRSDLRVLPRRAESERCMNRIIVGVDEIVQNSGMIRMRRKKRLEDRGRGDRTALVELMPFARSED